MPKILLLRHKLTAFGGAELIFIKEAHWLASHSCDTSVVVFELAPSLEEALKGVRHIVLKGGFWSEVFALRRLLLREKFDAVIAHENGHIHLFFASLFLSHKPRRFLNWYGSFLWLTGSRLNYSWFHRLAVKKLIKDWPGHKEFQKNYARNIGIIERCKSELQAVLDFFAIRAFDSIFTCSTYAVKECEMLYGREPIVVPGGVDTEAFTPLSSELAKQALGFADKKIIFTVNRLDHRKRIDFLIDAFKGVHSKNPTAILVIAGTGPEKEYLEKKAQGNKNAIIFAGFVKDELLPIYYAAADAVAYPAWCAWGLVPLEALSMNRKVVVVKDALIAEAVTGLPNAFVVDAEVDAFSEALHKSLYSSEGNSRDIIKSTLDWEVYFKKIKDIVFKPWRA